MKEEKPDYLVEYMSGQDNSERVFGPQGSYKLLIIVLAVIVIGIILTLI